MTAKQEIEVPELTVNEAVKAVKDHCPDQYARVYAEAMGQAIEMGGTEGMKVQLVYILSNTQQWRGEMARRAKTAIRKWLKDHKDV